MEIVEKLPLGKESYLRSALSSLLTFFTVQGMMQRGSLCKQNNNLGLLVSMLFSSSGIVAAKAVVCSKL